MGCPGEWRNPVCSGCFSSVGSALLRGPISFTWPAFGLFPVRSIVRVDCIYLIGCSGPGKS